ncbi:hypothetical protein Tco_1420989 [Tanacetum coccineum]
MVAFLEKSTGSDGFHQVIDFLARSYICYALTKKLAISVSFIKQFWRSAEASTDDNGEVKIIATFDGHSEIFEQLALMGYHADSDKLTFQKGAFSPQWRFIQICLDMQRNQLQQHSRTYPVPSLSMKVFNNMKRPTKGFSRQEVDLFPTMLHVPEPSPSPSRITSSPSHSPDIHLPHNTLYYTWNNITVDPTQPITCKSSPAQPAPTHHTPTHLSPRVEHHFPTPHDSPLYVVYSHGSDEGRLQLNELMNLVIKLSDRIGALEVDLKKTKNTYSSAYTKLILRVKKLESQLKTGKARRKAGVVLSDDEVIEDDSSK